MKSNISTQIEKILFSREEIGSRVRELGRQITADYRHDDADLLMICILKGAVFFMADLLKEIELDVEIDFMSVSSYGSSTVSSGDVRILKDLDQSITGKNILIVEDIIDTGYTLSYLQSNLRARGAKSVRIAALFNKPSRRVVDVKGDYIGFDIPDAFVVGYGLDFAQKLRNLPFVGILKPELYMEEGAPSAVSDADCAEKGRSNGEHNE
ncbi:MAG: hypoxanthine phosphoribosyltransferase [Ndongobacter sp.]|nr:hypoxanthine phosphoribosyltransferase [Ndongobacter sp.]